MGSLHDVDALHWARRSRNQAANRDLRNSLTSIEWRRESGRGWKMFENAPLLGPLPAPASQGEEEARSKKLRAKTAFFYARVAPLNTGNQPPTSALASAANGVLR